MSAPANDAGRRQCVTCDDELLPDQPRYHRHCRRCYAVLNGYRKPDDGTAHLGNVVPFRRPERATAQPYRHRGGYPDDAA